VSNPASAFPGAAAPGVADSQGQPYRVMIVDDSAVIRGLVTRSLEADPQVQVVASVSDGRMAINALARHDVEVVVLDVEMPVMDGLTALPQLIAAKPDLKVIMASTLTRRNADISLRALRAGAADYLAKPTSTGLANATDFKQELLAKVKALGQARRKAAGRPLPTRTEASPRPDQAARPEAPPRAAAPRPITLRAAAREPFEALAIGSSTGGPQALFEVLGAIRSTVTRPIFVTQHMPATFTTILAEHIARSTRWPAAEAVDGEPVRAGRVYIAPGDYHMVVDGGKGGEKLLHLSRAPAENFCRPSVDPMLRSLAQAYGRRLLCVILTGMGSDGRKGGEAVIAAGGSVLAQDEATSVVWGMPGAVASAGLCSAVLPLPEIGPFICKLAMRSAA
jgi:two-component system, chemotaxis family, protein-glutamate methylesterase/glutaminase